MVALFINVARMTVCFLTLMAFEAFRAFVQRNSSKLSLFQMIIFSLWYPVL